MRWNNDIATTPFWFTEISNRAAKEAAAQKLAAEAKSGDVIGAGSGSTSYLTLVALSKRIADEKLDVLAIPTSREVEITCTALGLRTTSLIAARPDWAFDGADEVDPDLSLIKGRGGALYREKLVMIAAPRRYIVVDASKFVDKLGSKFAVPVEVTPIAVHFVEEQLLQLGANDISVRQAAGKDGPVITEFGNLLLDVWFGSIPKTMERDIKAIPGVIASGLFIGFEPEIIS